MADNWRSKIITGGDVRAPNRAMLRAVDFGDGDFEKPIIGVANGHSNMNPCNAGIQPLVDRAMESIREANGMPQVFGVPTVTDGIGMGTDGMKYSLVSREVIADAIETSVNGQMMDGVLVVGACDKNMPAGMMAMARMPVLMRQWAHIVREKYRKRILWVLRRTHVQHSARVVECSQLIRCLLLLRHWG